MSLVFAIVVGLAVGAWNVWQRLGRTRRARAWSHSPDPEVRRKVLVAWPLFAIACLLGGVVGLVSVGPVVMTAAPLFLLALLIFLAYILLPLPVPRFLQPGWYERQTEWTEKSRD